MGRLSRIKELFNRQLPPYIEGNTIFRGVAFPLDDFLRGPIRFAKKLGAFLPIYVPDNSFKLIRAVTPPVEQLQVDNIISGLEINSLLLIANREMAKVEDFDASSNVIGLTDKIKATYDEGTQIILFAVPMTSTAAVTAIGSTTLSTQSSFRIYPGDTILIQTGDMIEALETIKVTVATQTGTIGSDFLFDITLESGISVALELDDELFIRAFPAYESQDLLLPDTHSPGPFVYDYVSGALIDSAYPTPGAFEIEETLTVTLLDIAGTVLSGPLAAEKNTLVSRIPIRNDMFLFWDLIEGRLNYNGDENRTMLITNDIGRASVLTHLVPAVDPDNTWQAGFRADKDCTVVVQFGDNPSVSFTLLAGISTTGAVGVLPLETAADKINISVIGDPSTTLLLSDWTVAGTQISKIHYSVVAEVTGLYTWGATGIIMKPMFFSLDLVTSVNDFSTFNNGGIFL